MSQDLEERFEAMDKTARTALKAGTWSFLVAGMAFADMVDYGTFTSGEFETINDYWQSIGIEKGLAKRLENAGRWLKENKLKEADLGGLTLSKVETIAGMKNPESTIKKAKELTLPDLKTWKIEKLGAVDVIRKVCAARCEHQKSDGSCDFGFPTKLGQAVDEQGHVV